MTDQSTQSIVIEADPAAIMAVIADFPAYPEWSKELSRVEVLAHDERGRATEVHFVLDAGVLKDDYTLEYTWADDGLAVDWHLTKGQMQKVQEGRYELREDGGRTEVTYTLTVDLAIPMIGLFKRKAEKVIMDTALKGLKRRVEEAK